MTWFEVWSGMTHALIFLLYFFFTECSRAGLNRVSKEGTAVSTVEAAGAKVPVPQHIRLLHPSPAAAATAPRPRQEEKTRTDTRPVHPTRDSRYLLLTHEAGRRGLAQGFVSSRCPSLLQAAA